MAGEFINTEPTLDNPDRALSYVWSFSVGVKHELFSDLAVSADYVGNRGRDITSLIDINEPRLLPNGSRVVRASACSTRTAPSFQRMRAAPISSACCSFRIWTRSTPTTTRSSSPSTSGTPTAGADGSPTPWPYSNDVQAATQGGFNLSLKRFSDDLDPRSDYGRAAFDNRHALVTSTYVTAWRGLGFGAVYKFYSGLPINETVGTDVNADRDNVDRPVKGIHDATRPIESEVDASGRAIRNGIDGPNIMQLDARAQYMFTLGNQRGLGLFWEIYNATNRANYARPSGNRRSSNFLVPTAADSPRTMQLGVRYDF